MKLLNTKIWLSLYLLLALLPPSASQDFVINLPSTQLSLNQNADYKIATGPTDMTGYFIPSGSTLLVSLPPQYNTTALHSKTYSGYSASYGDNCYFDFACTGVTVTFKGNSFAINGMFTSDIQASDVWFFQYTILSVQNPNTFSLGAFAVTIFLGTTIYYPAGSASSVAFKANLAAQAVTYSVQVMNPTIWGVSPLKFTITPNNVIDTIRIKFPNTAWTGETRTNTAATTSNLNFISTSNPTITATNLVSYYAITNLNYYTALVPIDITVNSITNPSSLMAAGSIVLSLVYSNNVLETSTFSIPASSFTNDVLRNIATAYTDLASDKVQVQLKFQFAEINGNTDKIYVTFPSELVLPTTNASYTIKMATATVTPALSINSGTNTVSFNVSSASIYQIAVILTVTDIARPRECKNTSSFAVKTLRLNLYLMDSNACCNLQLSNRQSLVVNSIALSNNHRLQTSVTYTFNFSTAVITLIATDVIQIQFPPEYKSIINSANSATLCASANIGIVGVNFPALVKTATCTMALNQITLSSFLTGSETASQTFVITLSGITNPSISSSTGFTISTLSSAGYVLEQSQGNTITIQPNTLTSFTVNANSLQTCAANTIYTFTAGNNSPLYNGYTIAITFPSDFTYVNYNTIQCKINAVVFTCTRANSTYHTSNIIVVIQVSTTINTITSLTIGSVTNPISFATTGSFSASIYDQTGTAVESSSGSATIQMTSTSSFSLFSSTATNYSAATSIIQTAVETISTTSNSVWLTITTPFTPLVTPASLLIIFSNANYLSYNILSTCVSAQISSLCTLTTNVGTNNVEVSFSSLAFVTPSSNLLQIEITYLTILNHQNLQITATMNINGLASLSLSPASTISKVYAQPVSNYGLALSSQILGQACTATLTITLSAVSLSQLSYFIVYVPQQFGAASRIINVPLASFVLSQITIASLTNPTTQSYTPFLFAAYDSNGNVIAFSTPTLSTKVYAFTLACTLPCRTCTTSTVCLDCYTTVSWIPQIYYRSSAQTCVTQCVEGEYLSNGVCLACDPTCLTCLMYSSSSYANGNSTYCLTCASTKLMHVNTCVATCPSGSYASQSYCKACMTNCLNCTSYSTCSSCQSGYSLYSNVCVSTCPDSTVSFTNAVTSQASCISCPTNCISCSSLASPQCLSCKYPYYLYNGACYSSCSSLSLYISYQMTCTACQCLTCLNYAYNCASCASPYNLYQSQCIINCPTGYYPSFNVCQACTTNCLSCTSAAYCLLCQIPYALYIANVSSASCLATCPNNTIATIDSSSFIYVCEACGGNCQTCQISITFCLSCKTGFILNNNTCVSSCPTGLWMISGSCVTCSAACRVCQASDPYNCTLCSPNYFYYNFTCDLYCPTGTYPDVIALSCKACDVVCSACMNATNCTACATGYYLYNSYCFNNCLSINSLFYNYNGTCMTCQPQCTTCLATPVQCSSCSSSSYYFNPVDSSCSLSCATPYYINGATCSLCQSPCSTCDTLYDSCLSCIGTLSVWNGKCYATCPSGYYSSSNVCLQCASACLTCTASACQTCQTYAFRYKQTCILDCSNSSLPITIDNYCTNCANVPYCEACQTTSNNNYYCFSCILPYVIFQGNCLNKCPDLYAVDNTSNTCLPTPAYAEYMNNLYTQNYPYFPPFCYFALLAIAGAVLAAVTKRIYKYTYHFGYLIALSSAVELLFIIYGLGYIVALYQGDYTKQNKLMPVAVLMGSYLCKMILGAVFALFVLVGYYLKDSRFREWKEQHQRGFKISILLTIIFGSRFYKLYYSKFLGKDIFSYRVVSVQKFYYEDIITWISFLFDIADIAALVIINYNIFITYAVLYFLSFELLLFKAAQWIMLAYDLKKPDRGFFLGDEEEAARMIQQELQAKQKEKRKFEMESLVKLIRRKSAGNLHYDKLYEHLFIDDFRSVFDPSDYEDVPKVPNRKIEKNINKGKFRKGKRITIEQKLKRFAQSIKPSPVASKDNGYINNLLYWKPPKQLKVQPKKPQMESQESMMKLLQDKELYYEGITSVQIIDLDDYSGVQRDMPSRFRKRKRTGLGMDGQETVINETFDHYDPSSVEFLQPDDHDLNGLWNRNYAKRQHLPQSISPNRYDQNELRVLYHQPLKKRRSKLNELRSRHF